MLQIAGGVVAAGVVAAGTTALTGAGVVFTGGSTPGVGGDNQFIGGAVSQVINGATVNSVTLTTDGTGTHTTRIVVVVAGANGKTLTITPTGGSGLSGGATQWSCAGNINAGPVLHASAPVVTLTAATATVTCDTMDANPSVAGYYLGITSVGLAVA
ncbi:hypothetical protein [Actinoplanes subtropicus]|uniref:hypothetical protein n=1 Tax=Actinoplanes subtropicus TaxID=543632 RepID=UPI0012F967ED|nr:hypothetical protein [Actinoplanes subtropicus]